MSNANHQVASLWTHAIKEYETITKKKLDDPTLRGITTVDALLDTVDRENKAFSDFRQKGQRVRDVVKCAMTPIELVGNVVSGGASAAFPPSAYVFGGVKLLIGAAKGVSEKYDAIVQTISALKDVTIRLEVYAQQTISQRLGEKLTEILVALLEVLAFAHKEIKHGRLISYGKSILAGNDGAKDAMDKFTRLVDVETALVSAETHTEVKLGFARVNSDLRKISRRLDEAKLQDEDMPSEDMMKKLRQLLKPTSSSEDRYDSMRRARVPGTGDWLREEKEFIDWMNGERPILWVSGNPGAGKSYLATNIVSYLEEGTGGIPRGFFFFKDDDLATRSVGQALRNIAFQLCQGDPLYAKHVYNSMDSPGDEWSVRSLWRKLFLEVFLTQDNDLSAKTRTSNRPVHLVLDALDESYPDDRAELFELLEDLQNSQSLHVLMLGRPQIAEEMIDLMNTLKVSTIDVSEGNNFDDIVHFIKTTIEKSVYLRKLPKPVQRQIVQELSTGSQGMFLWVSLMMQELSRIRTKGEVQKRLSQAPKGLSKMISHVLRGFSEMIADDFQLADDLNELLAWIVCAERPLTLEEAENILKWRSPEGDGWIWLEGSLRGQFASVFSLKREDGLSTADLKRIANSYSETFAELGQFAEEYDSNDDYYGDAMNDLDSDPKTTTITFSHASLGEFFKSQKEKVQARPNFPYIGVNYREAQLLVLTRCFEVLQETEPPKDKAAICLRAFASNSSVGLLKSIDINQHPISQVQLVGSKLAQALSQESLIARFVIPDRINIHRDTLEIFDRWLGRTDVQDALVKETKVWLQDAIAEHPAEIFRPMANYIASKVLSLQLVHENVWASRLHIRDLVNFQVLRGLSPTLSTRKFWDTRDLIIHSLLLADWVQPRFDAHWYGKVGMIFGMFFEFDNAKEYLHKSLDMEPDQWVVRHNLANCLGGRQNSDAEIEEAIRLYQMSIHQLKTQQQASDTTRRLHDEYERLASCYNNFKDPRRALETFQVAFSLNKRCTKCMQSILTQQSLNGTPGDMAMLLQTLHQGNVAEDPGVLVELLLQNPSIDRTTEPSILAAIFHSGLSAYIVRAYKEASTLARHRRKPLTAIRLKIKLATFLYSYGQDMDGSFEICQQLLHTYKPNHKDGSLVADYLKSAMLLICDYYIRASSQPGCSELELESYAEVLESLLASSSSSLGPIKQIQSPSDGEDELSLQIRLSMGVFYKTCGRNLDALRYFRPLIQKHGYRLRPSLPDRYMDDLIGLLRVLIAIQDFRNAVAIVYHMENLRREVARSVKVTLAVHGPYCDECGQSTRMEGLALRFYSHRPDLIALCETCYPRLRSGTLSLSFCDPNDDFIVIPPEPAQVKERTQEHRFMLYVDCDWMTIEDFKLHLKEEYDLSQVSDPSGQF